MRPSPNDRCPCGSGKKYKRCCLAPGASPEPETRAFLEEALVRLERLMGEAGPLGEIRFEPEHFSRVVAESCAQLERLGLPSNAEELFERLFESSVGALWRPDFVERARARLQAALDAGLEEADAAAVALGLSTLERGAAREEKAPMLCPVPLLAFRLQLRAWLDGQRQLARLLEETVVELQAGRIDPSEAERRIGSAAPSPALVPDNPEAEPG